MVWGPNNVTQCMNMKKNKSVWTEKEGPQLIITAVGSPLGCSLKVKKEKSRKKKRRTSTDAQALALWYPVIAGDIASSWWGKAGSGLSKQVGPIWKQAGQLPTRGKICYWRRKGKEKQYAFSKGEQQNEEHVSAESRSAAALLQLQAGGC